MTDTTKQVVAWTLVTLSLLLFLISVLAKAGPVMGAAQPPPPDPPVTSIGDAFVQIKPSDSVPECNFTRNGMLRSFMVGGFTLGDPDQDYVLNDNPGFEPLTGRSYLIYCNGQRWQLVVTWP